MKTYTVTEKLGKDLKVGDEIWWDDENKFIAITEEYLKEALAFAKEEVEKSTYLVRTSIPQQDKWKEAQLKLCEILNDKVIHPHINSDMEQLISTMEIEYKDGWQPIN